MTTTSFTTIPFIFSQGAGTALAGSSTQPGSGTPPSNTIAAKAKDTLQNIFKMEAKPEAGKDAAKPEAGTKGTKPEAGTKGTKPETGTKGTKPEAGTKGTKPETDSKEAKPATTTGKQSTEQQPQPQQPVEQGVTPGLLVPVSIFLLLLLIVLSWMHLYSIIRKLEQKVHALSAGNRGNQPASGPTGGAPRPTPAPVHTHAASAPSALPRSYEQWKDSVLPEDDFALRPHEIMRIPAGPDVRVVPVDATGAPAIRHTQRSVRELADFFNSLAQRYEANGALHLLMQQRDLQERVLWVLGDIHGSAAELEASLSWINATMDRRRRNTIIFLGDLIDRADCHHHIAVFNLLADAHQMGAEVVYLRGNHDDALHYRTDTRQFVSDVNPSEFVDQLNDDPTLHPLGMSLIRFFQACPVSLCACYGRSGEAVFMSHAGVPHDDVLKSWYESTQQQAAYPGGGIPASEFWVRDCIWARITTQMLKNPARGIKGHELGRLNLRLFTQLFAQRTGMRLSSIIHGHEHPKAGFSLDDESAELAGCHVITLANLGAEPGETFTGDRKPTILRWDVAGNSLEIQPISNH